MLAIIGGLGYFALLLIHGDLPDETTEAALAHIAGRDEWRLFVLPSRRRFTVTKGPRGACVRSEHVVVGQVAVTPHLKEPFAVAVALI